MPAANRKPIPSASQGSGQPAPGPLGPTLVAAPAKPPTMRKAVAEARREIALTLPLVVRTLAKEAIEGSVNHLKLYLELSGVLKGGLAAPEKVVRERTLEEVLMEHWEQDKAIEAADRADRARSDKEQAERNRERAEEVLSGI